MFNCLSLQHYSYSHFIFLQIPFFLQTRILYFFPLFFLGIWLHIAPVSIYVLLSWSMNDLTISVGTFCTVNSFYLWYMYIVFIFNTGLSGHIGHFLGFHQSELFCLLFLLHCAVWRSMTVQHCANTPPFVAGSNT